MGSIPMPFFATRAASLYTERVRADKQRKPKQPDVILSDQSGRTEPDAPKYNNKLMNSIWGFYNQYAPFQFQKNQESPLDSGLACLGASYKSI